MPNLAQVFEHGTLAVGERGFTVGQFEALARYNDRHNCAFFKVGHQRLHFTNCVGVIQVGKLTIEILPKTEKGATTDKGKWQRALLQMLRQAGLLTVTAAPEADLHLTKSSLIDLYLDAFLNEVECLSHAGLVKKYRTTEANLYKLKGRIVFQKQISRNLLHRERMYTSHQTYDRDNVFNRILKRGLNIIHGMAINPFISTRAATLNLHLEDISETKITEKTFDRLVLDRNTARYQKALQLARLIILNYSPDLRGGQEHVVAILFDMNKLFERFILVQLLRAQGRYGDRMLHIRGQASKLFWAWKKIRPDVVADFRIGEFRERVILDTKWKVPHDSLPEDSDLKQMYTYNLHFGGRRSALLYPRCDNRDVATRKVYAPSTTLPPSYAHECGTYFVDLFDDHQRLRSDIGREVIERVILESSE
jgi:5-methylcytosine-specific restriction enzyme subunit McrC